MEEINGKIFESIKVQDEKVSGKVNEVMNYVLTQLMDTIEDEDYICEGTETLNTMAEIYAKIDDGILEFNDLIAITKHPMGGFVVDYDYKEGGEE